MIYYQAIGASLASQFLNLDDHPSECTDQTMTPDIRPPVRPSCTIVGTPTGENLERGAGQ
jgi:hypothetical protein